jgi:acyl dehydratase
MTAKFLKPVYDGEPVVVRSQVTECDPVSLELELRNAGDVLCAVGTAGLSTRRTPPDPSTYPSRPLPTWDQRGPASASALPAGTGLGSFEFDLDLAAMASSYPEKMRDPLPIYGGDTPVCHPAFLLEQANRILMHNVELGPWIHTGSEVQHYSLPRDGETLSLRGSVVDSFVKRGRDFAVLDLALFGPDSRPVAHIRHTAIIRLPLG